MPGLGNGRLECLRSALHLGLNEGFAALPACFQARRRRGYTIVAFT
jgi:hypothetical protein